MRDQGEMVKRDQRGEPDLLPGPARDLVDLYKRLRYARQLSIGQIAIKTGLSPGHVSEVLRGWKAPSPGTAARIAIALGADQPTTLRARQLAEDLLNLNRHARRRAREAGQVTEAAGPRRPGAGAGDAPPAGGNGPVSIIHTGGTWRYRVTGIRPANRYVGLISGDLRRVHGIDVWVNSENTEMEMARFNEFSISSVIRYEGADRDKSGRVVNDSIASELARKVMDSRPVLPATAIITGPGELTHYQVRFVAHVAAVQGEPGAGYRQIRDIGRCVTNVLEKVDGLGAEPPLETILFPLLGTGSGGGELHATFSSLVGAAIDYFTAAPRTGITTVFFLTYTDVQLAECLTIMAGHSRLRKT
jgi:O-acetyl-ADP-ribose deacetylase (regulator of RNase III)/transcriptional regulator with XRE-family HTH domain